MAANTVGAKPRMRRFRFEPDGGGRLTHHLFRFPAKFHPPVIRQLLRDYTEPGETVLDPFCGSGTILVEAAVLGRTSVGIDVDPLSAFVSRVKAHAIRGSELSKTVSKLTEVTRELSRPADELAILAKDDLDESDYLSQLDGSWVPDIPKLEHWFYRYALVDLALLLEAIKQLDIPGTHQDFLTLVFAAIIRSASRADPVPVSGLEVTKVMLEKEKEGRSIDVARLFDRRLRRAVQDMEAFYEAKAPSAKCRVVRADAAALSGSICPTVDAVITSPPYHGAVDYYRRHQLEMFWLGFTDSQAERLLLLEEYLGRPKVPQRHPYVKAEDLDLAGIISVEKRMRAVSGERADAFKHYAIGMSYAVANMAKRLSPKSPFVLVVGHSSWNGGSIDTSALVEELAKPYFALTDRQWYPVKNRYMSYARRNGADIDREYVLVLERTDVEVS